MTGSASWTPSFEHRTEIDLPEGWTYAPLGKLGSWGTGNTPSKANQAFWIGGTLPWVSPKDMKSAYLDDAIDHVTERAVAEGGAAVVPPGTLFFVVRGMILAHTFPVAMITKRAAFNQDMRSLIPHEGILAPYLLRALQREGPAILGMVREATHGTLRLESGVLQSWPIPIAPVNEQRRIVESVEVLLDQVNRTAARLERIPLILKRFRSSVFAAACSGELTKEWRDRSGSGSLPDRKKPGVPSNDLPDFVEHLEGEEFPRSWSRTRVDGLVTIQNGRAFPSKEYLDHDGVRLLRPGNLHVKGKVEWDATNTVSLPKKWAHDFPEFVLGAGELLMNLTAQSLKDEFLGRVCLKSDSEPALLNQRIARLSPLTAYDVRPYLLLYFKSRFFRSFVNGLDTGSLIRHMHSKDVARHVLPLPPPDEQAEIVRQVQRLIALADALERRLAVAMARTEKLPQAILSKAFSGELIPQHPNDEPAAALLARFRTEEENMQTRRRPPRGKGPKSMEKGAERKPRDLVELIAGSKRGMAPEDLFGRAGYRADDPDDVARFYEALRDAVNKGLLREERTANGDPRIAINP